MSTKKDNSSIIKNADTRARREWIEEALDRVRTHLDTGAFVPSTLESLGHEEAVAAQPEVRVERRKHPHIYIAWSNGERRERRSGT